MQFNNGLFAHSNGAVILVGLLWSSAFTGFAQYTDGIYAEFNTSMGSYTCRLEYALAPKAVANFIGLATGQRSWLDLPTGLVKTAPFYNGTTFHRIIGGFMNQGGSPNGQGTDGPGYAFVDEFSASLPHDRFGVLSMANSGPDSNGSQYFITVEPTPWLNDLHTVFGRLYGGSNVVYAINHVATDGNNKPLTNVTVQSVIIRRVGTAANAFDINGQGLPLVTNINLKIAKAAPKVTLTFSNQLYADSRFYASGNLTDWISSKLGIDVSGTPTNSITVAVSTPKQFFHAAQILYPSSTFSPKTVFGRTLTMVFTNGTTGTLASTFNSSGFYGVGTYNYNGSPGDLYGYYWLQEPYNGRLWPIGFVQLNLDMTVALNFDTAAAGGFTGTIYPAPYYYNPNFPNPLAYDVAGSFTISP